MAVKYFKKDNNMKNTSKEFLLDLASQFPDIEKFPLFKTLIDRMPDDATLARMEAEFNAAMEATGELVIDCSDEDIDLTMPITSTSPRTTSAPCSTGTQHISIRIPGTILGACRVQAKKKGIPYQTLINRVLKQAVAEWD